MCAIVKVNTASSILVDLLVSSTSPDYSVVCYRRRIYGIVYVARRIIRSSLSFQLIVQRRWYHLTYYNLFAFITANGALSISPDRSLIRQRHSSYCIDYYTTWPITYSPTAELILYWSLYRLAHHLLADGRAKIVLIIPAPDPSFARQQRHNQYRIDYTSCPIICSLSPPLIPRRLYQSTSFLFANSRASIV